MGKNSGQVDKGAFNYKLHMCNKNKVFCFVFKKTPPGQVLFNRKLENEFVFNRLLRNKLISRQMKAENNLSNTAVLLT